MADGGIVAIVPFKGRQQAKQRLAPVLSAQERAGLAHAMAEDVLAALANVPAFAGIIMVTRDPEMRGPAARFGARLVADTECRGINAAIGLAMRALASAGARGMLVVPADVPLVSRTEIEDVLAAHRGDPAVTLVPASIDMGTNGLACSPVGVIAPQFGPASFHRHRDAAQAIALEPRVLPMPGWGRDIDRPADLLALAASPSATRSYAFVAEHRIAERLRSRMDGAGAQRPLRRGG